jgi:dihydroorotate dehydrogenase electron transfer subunit
VGVPPLYKLCKELVKQGMRPAVVLGFNTQAEIFLAAEFKALGADVTVTTADGSFGIKGFVTHGAQNLAGMFDYVYACGPEPMLKAVFQLCRELGITGQLSLEERMACGFGACMGCTIQTSNGAKRVCADGPVFETEELPW